MVTLRQVEQFILQFLAVFVLQLAALDGMPRSVEDLYRPAIAALAAVVGVYVAAKAPGLVSGGTRDTILKRAA